MQGKQGGGVAADGRLSFTGWLVCAIAAIGFAFDIYELLMLPLIIKPAIQELSKPEIAGLVAGGISQADATALWIPGGKSYVGWARTLFFVPAIAGGVFGLLGGYLVRNQGVGKAAGPRAQILLLRGEGEVHGAPISRR